MCIYAQFEIIRLVKCPLNILITVFTVIEFQNFKFLDHPTFIQICMFYL